MSGPVRAALFDVDGTLVDTNYLHAVTWWEAFTQAGYQAAMADIHRVIGMGSDQLLDQLLPVGRDKDGDAAVRAAHSTLYATYWSRLRPLPGAADLPDVETWLASGPGTPARQRWVSEEKCTVGGDAGGCPRPGAGGRGLCHAHDVAWAAQHRAGKDLAGFLASATPLPGFGGCVAASCYLAAAHGGYPSWCALSCSMPLAAGCRRRFAPGRQHARLRRPAALGSRHLRTGLRPALP